MAEKGSWGFLSTVCIACFLVVNADIPASGPVGELFVYELQREIFQNDFEALKVYGKVYYDPMVFKCSRQSFPDLPEWLRFTQRHPYDNGFLYGTPLAEGKTVIEITVINQRTFNTFSESLVINIVKQKHNMPYQAEFFISLREIEKVLPSDVQDEIKQDLQKLWGTEKLYFVNITSALDRGGRVPLPLPGHFEGVYVKLGSPHHYSKCLLGLRAPNHQTQCEAGGKILEDCTACSYPSNCITWCKSTLIDLSRPVAVPPAPTMGSGILESGGVYDPPAYPLPRDFFPDYVVTVVAPLVLAIILCLLLTYIMCCRREGVEKRNLMTPDIQLYHHYTIHHNICELHSMAGNREAPQPLSTLPMFNTHTGERSAPTDSLAQHDPDTDTLPRK